jgi:hypothetical protein
MHCPLSITYGILSLTNSTFLIADTILFQTNSVAFSPQANYTDWRPPLVGEI